MKTADRAQKPHPVCGIEKKGDARQRRPKSSIKEIITMLLYHTLEKNQGEVR